MTTWKRPYLLAASSAAIVLGQALAPGAGGYAASGSSSASSQLTFVGVTNLAGAGNDVTDSLNDWTGPSPAIPSHAPKNPTLVHVSAAGVPNPPGNPVVVDATQPGFNGIAHRNQRFAGTGAYLNTNFSLEPPDQGLCVGGGFVLETVNDALRVYTTSGTAVTPTQALNQFFQAKPSITRANPIVYGDFVSDPKCYYDPADGRWFLTSLQIDLVPSTGAFGARAHNYIGVSQTGNPAGTWNIYKFDVSDDGTNGTPSHTGCPCFGDQPLIGADASGFYITTNEYNLHPFGSIFNGSQVYAMSKAGLETGTNLRVVQINAGPLTTSLPSGGTAFSLQPATAPTADGNETARGGTEYFVSATDWGAAPAIGTRADRILVWALTNTSSLDSNKADVHLSFVALNSEVYVQPPNAQQRPGPTPLGDALHEPLTLVAANDDRMNQVVFAGGRLWSGLNTAVQTANGPTRVGAAYFVVTPSVSGGAVSASIATQGYVAVNQENVLFPSIGVTGDGAALMTFTVVGPDFFPSAAYAKFDASGAVGDVHIAASGIGPEDGFSGYEHYGGADIARWGDYTAAGADSDGTVWFAAEWIGPTQRTLLANWGTFVGHVTP
ncbi:MAG TPA: hypothetical protein VET82_05440 [Candidatus Eisenbacteria bacterium]|nr:hypothetical protein [Candidatus Eisenbacteria bacterium]